MAVEVRGAATLAPISRRLRHATISLEDMPGSCEDPEQFIGKDELGASQPGSAEALAAIPAGRLPLLLQFKDWTMKQIGCALRVKKSRISQMH